MTSACTAAGCRVLAAVTEAYANASAANVPVLPLAGNHTIDDLKRSKANLRRRCLDLFSKLTEARARINDLERELSVMKYVVKYASKSSERGAPLKWQCDRPRAVHPVRDRSCFCRARIRIIGCERVRCMYLRGRLGSRRCEV